MNIKRWQISKIDGQKSKQLAEQTGLSPLACDILQARGIDAPQQLEDFFSEGFCDPFLLPDMDRAVERIQRAIEGQEPVCIYGDYDCDGVTSTVLLYTYLQTVGADVSYYIPDREREGYGMNAGAVRSLADQGVSLIVTVDNGVSALEEIRLANELGMDVVVTDHHQPREELPTAAAVVDPHRADCDLPFRNWAGVGVTFKLICALEGGDGAELMEYYGDLTCIGTVADIVSLTGENRAIVKRGLEHLQYTDNVGLQALLEVSGLSGKRLSCENVGFVLAPRINAAGRLGFTHKAVELLLSEDEEEALELAQFITEQNRARQGVEAEILRDISREIAAHPELLYQRLLVLSGEGWHQGIIGIVCSKLMERYAKPCLLISVEGEAARGSGRSVEGFSLVDAVSRCSRHLTHYGGHTMAAGFSLESRHLEEFRRQLYEDAKERYERMPVMTIRVDREVLPSELTVESLKSLEALEPFGTGNEPPVLAVLDARLEGIYPMGSDGGHLRLRLNKNGRNFYAVYFGMSQDRFPYAVGDRVDLAANCDVNVYQGEERVSVKVKALRPAGVDLEPLFEGIQQYDRFRREEPFLESGAAPVPSRDDVAVLYRWLREHKGYTGDLELLSCRLPQVGYCKLRLSLDVMEEMGLVSCRPDKKGVHVELLPVSGKVDLTKSAILHKLC